MEVTDAMNIEFIRTLLIEGKPFNEIMQNVMKVGAEFAKEHGNVDYDSPEAVFLAIKEGNSPLTKIDKDVATDCEDAGTNLICVKQCAMKDIMSEMSDSSGSDNKVDTVMDGHHLREGEESNYIDVGCYIMQQLRQMIISSLSINGKYTLNYIHLGCDKGTGKRTISRGDMNAINVNEDQLNRLLDQYDCVYAISHNSN